jgi:Raf kinase inhibitor-like YbhB/YbcL family protein
MNTQKALWLCAGLLIVSLAACAPAADPAPTMNGEVSESATSTSMETIATVPTATLEPFEISSPDFAEGEAIPSRFACNGENLSPELVWNEPPVGTQSFALIFNDPDANSLGWVHWVVYNLPAESRGIPEGVAPGEEIPSGGLHGASSWRVLQYGGPCPPTGVTHNYEFILYALDTMLDVEKPVDKAALLLAMEGHILAETKLTAPFVR